MQRINQLSTFLILTLACIFIAACVTEGGKKGPLNSAEGRKEAVQAYVDLAFGYVQDGQTEQAKQPLLEALKIDSNSAEANAALAYVFQIEQDNENAEQYFKKALSAAPNDSRILNNYGVFLFGLNRLAEAKDVFTKASDDSFYSGRSMVFENLGLIAMRENKLPEAETNFLQALRLNRGRVLSNLSLADIYYQKKNYQSALGYYNNFVILTEGKQNPQSLLLGIRLSNALNDKAKAAGYASQLQQLYPSSAEYRAYKAGSK